MMVVEVMGAYKRRLSHRLRGSVAPQREDALGRRAASNISDGPAAISICTGCTACAECRSPPPASIRADPAARSGAALLPSAGHTRQWPRPADRRGSNRRLADRTRGGSGKGGAVQVDLVGRRIIKKKK